MIRVNERLVFRNRLMRMRRPLYTDNEQGILFLCWLVPAMFIYLW
jgi:hypothetical protein